jgi:hypothetical protein
MMVSWPSPAAAGPPEIGASTQPMPVSRIRRSARASVRSGLMVEQSINSEAPDLARARPWESKQHCSTASPFKMQKMTMSLVARTAAGLSSTVAPETSA